MKEELDLRKDSHFLFWDSLSIEEKSESITKIKSQIGIHSEIGRLRKVLLHSPGPEVELMTPQNALELLYNDIIYYKNIVSDHAQLKSVLSLVSQVLEVSKCLQDILDYTHARDELLNQVLYYQGCPELKQELMEMPSKELAKKLISGVPLKRNSIDSWLSSRTFSLLPLPNMYFMRDTSMVIGTKVVTSRMASPVRFTESLILRSIYEFHPSLKGHGLLLDACHKNNDPKFTLEGGDVLVVNPDLLLVGISERTSAKAVDALIDSFLRARECERITKPFHVFCVVLPHERSTIHLDMIFTIVNKEQAVVYLPYILGREKVRVIRMQVNSNGEKKFKEMDDLISGLHSVGVRIEPISCGGNQPLYQQREQWNSGANMFSFAPGKVISYLHEHTLRACESSGFKILSAKDVVKHPELLQSKSPMVVTVEGSELSRGGGGPRCMTCPILRDPVP